MTILLRDNSFRTIFIQQLFLRYVFSGHFVMGQFIAAQYFSLHFSSRDNFLKNIYLRENSSPSDCSFDRSSRDTLFWNNSVRDNFFQYNYFRDRDNSSPRQFFLRYVFSRHFILEQFLPGQFFSLQLIYFRDNSSPRQFIPGQSDHNNYSKEISFLDIYS